MRRLHLSCAGFALAFVSGLACGGLVAGPKVEPGGDGGTPDARRSEAGRVDTGVPAPDAGRVPDAGVDVGHPVPDATHIRDASVSVCPASAPSAGETCTRAGLECEYGSSPNPACNDLWTCSGSTWTHTPHGGACPSPSGTCPSYATASARGSCSPDSLICAYPQGTCICTDDPGGLPTMGGPDWFCTATTTGCPATRPALGSACSDPSLKDCDYGQCSGGVGEACTDGYWTLAMVACPA